MWTNISNIYWAYHIYIYISAVVTVMLSHCFNHSCIYNKWGHWSLPYHSLIHLSNKELIHSFHVITSCWYYHHTLDHEEYSTHTDPFNDCHKFWKRQTYHPHFELRWWSQRYPWASMHKCTKRTIQYMFQTPSPSNYMSSHRELLKNYFPCLVLEYLVMYSR